ncbi:AraC-like DNA-binding protein [Amorphus suaedae]
MHGDPISDILALTDARTTVSGGFTAGGDWSIRFPPPGRIKFFALIRGRCALRMEGSDTVVPIGCGDVFLPSATSGFVLSGGAGAVPMDAAPLFADAPETIVAVGGGNDCLVIGGHVHLNPVSGSLLSEILPPLVHVPAADERAAPIRWLLDQLMAERAAAAPGADIARAQIAQLMFVHLIRAHLAGGGAIPIGLLRAAGDPRLMAALRLIHGDPARNWRLAELAAAAGMSRTNFSLRFREAAGVAPLAYHTRWRMRLADRMLREGQAPISAVARSLGYASESAFSSAFKRVTGSAPHHYRRAAAGPRSGS